MSLGENQNNVAHFDLMTYFYFVVTKYGICSFQSGFQNTVLYS